MHAHQGQCIRARVEWCNGCFVIMVNETNVQRVQHYLDGRNNGEIGARWSNEGLNCCGGV